MDIKKAAITPEPEPETSYIPMPTMKDIETVNLSTKDWLGTSPDESRGVRALRMMIDGGSITVGRLVNTKEKYGNNTSDVWETSDGKRFTSITRGRKHEFNTHIIPMLRREGYLAPESKPDHN